MSGFYVGDGPTLAECLASLRATAGTHVPAPRRPMSDEAIEFESAQESMAEAMKDAREAGVSGAESDRAADREWDERQRDLR